MLGVPETRNQYVCLGLAFHQFPVLFRYFAFLVSTTSPSRYQGPEYADNGLFSRIQKIVTFGSSARRSGSS